MIYVCSEQEKDLSLHCQWNTLAHLSSFLPLTAFEKEFITGGTIQCSEAEVFSRQQRSEAESFVLSKMQKLNTYWEYY